MIGFFNLNEIENRKKKILSFLEKDMYIVNNYESAPFKNKNHAIECLIPYHIYQIMADDFKFKGSDVDISLDYEVDRLIKHIDEMIEDTTHIEDGFTPQLMLYHEQRYINTMFEQNKNSEASLFNYNHDNKKVKRIRIKKLCNIFVYGPLNAIRIKISGITNN